MNADHPAVARDEARLDRVHGNALGDRRRRRVDEPLDGEVEERVPLAVLTGSRTTEIGGGLPLGF